MTKTLLTIVLGCAVAVAQNPAPAQPQTQPAPQPTAPATQPQQAQPSVQPGAPAAPQQKKEIKDPAEYNAYVGAVQQSDPAAKINTRRLARTRQFMFVPPDLSAGRTRKF